MKKKVLFVLLGFALMALTFTGSEARAADPAAKPVKLSFGHIWSTSTWYHGLIEQWAKRIEQGTNGSVQFVIYPASQLAKPTDFYRMTVSGGADSSIGLPGWVVGRFPLTLLVESPPCFPLGGQNGPLYWNLYNNEKALQKEWSEVKMIFISAQTAQHLMTRNPIRKLEDIKGKEIRTYGPTTAIAEALGAVPVSMPITEAYIALQKGIVEGVMGPWVSLQTYKFDEVTKYGLELNAQSAIFVGIMNLKRWNSLTPEQQRIIMENGDWIAKEYGKEYDEADKKAFDAAVQQKGFQVTKLADPGEMKKWQELINSTAIKYTEKLEADGLPGKQIYNEKVDLMKKMGK